MTFNRKAPGFCAGETAEVVRVDGGGVWLRAAAGGERRLPLGGSDFSVARQREIEVSPGDRLLVRANDRAQGLINGETLTVTALRNGVIETAEGGRIDTARFRRFSHGFAVTSHKSQSKTADHVVVAAERLNGKAAYVACSRGRYTRSVHTPDKAVLLAELPEGNRLAALDFLGPGTPPPTPGNPERERAWVVARDWLRHTTERVARGVQAAGRAWSRDGLRTPSLGLHGRVDAAQSKDSPGDGRSRL